MSGPSNEPPIVTVVGERVALGPLRRDLLPLYQRWINDLSAVRNFGVPPRPQTAEQEAAWYDAAATAADTTSFTVYERATWRSVGTTALRAIDFRHRRAEFGILIGADDRGKGYGTEATRLTLDYAFTALGLHNVMLRVYEYNLAGRRAYAKAGFREFGRRRQAQWMGGRFWDEIYMECLATELRSPVLGRVFVPDKPTG
ncbi:MAG: GNAT family protein [Sphaerobacter sp.]|nr:GNAT family protein [Sphaerobacter sp.]